MPPSRRPAPETEDANSPPEDVPAGRFCVWRLRVRPGCEADLTCDDGDGRVIARQHLSFTDFPLPEATLYLEYGTLMLPSER
jgi:hypothetical protein